MTNLFIVATHPDFAEPITGYWYPGPYEFKLEAEGMLARLKKEFPEYTFRLQDQPAMTEEEE